MVPAIAQSVKDLLSYVASWEVKFEEGCREKETREKGRKLERMGAVRIGLLRF